MKLLMYFCGNVTAREGLERISGHVTVRERMRVDKHCWTYKARGIQRLKVQFVGQTGWVSRAESMFQKGVFVFTR